jgi:hypothetical protein
MLTTTRAAAAPAALGATGDPCGRDAISPLTGKTQRHRPGE